MKLELAKKLRNTLGGWNFLHPRNGSLISSAIIALALGVAFIGCGGGGGGSDSSSAYSVFVHNGDVYVAGMIARHQGGACFPSTEAALWKNGAIHFQFCPDPPNNAHVLFDYVCATDSDVFVLGYDGVQNMLWKNGVAQSLPGGDCLGLSTIFVSGDDLYLAGGSSINPEDRCLPMLWKNGIAQYLDDDGTVGGYILSIFVSGSDVYAAGNAAIVQSPDAGIVRSLAIWKNGVRQHLDDCGSVASLFVSGEDVYVAGTYGSSAVIWKNGVRQVLADAQQMPGGYYVDSRAYSVSVSDGDVYVGGEVANQAVIWKNGVMRNLSKSGNYPAARSVFVSDGDVYVAGKEELATVWKNGVAQTLPLK